MLENGIDEAIRELNIKDAPNLYRMLRRWAREHIKKEVVSPIDMINWPKGCLMLGLMHQACFREDEYRDKCKEAVASYLDKWINKGSPIYTIDDCLAGIALLMLTESADDTKKQRYNIAADNMMEFLKNHDQDMQGSWPYRPLHKNGRIFADGIGMAAPFAIYYGLLNKDETAIDLGIRQIDNYFTYGIDKITGLPHHAYSLNEDGTIVHFGAIGWGRAVGWIALGLKESLWAFNHINRELSEHEKDIKIRLEERLATLTENVKLYQRKDGLFGSQLLDKAAPIDISASAMIIYAMGEYPDGIKAYISEDGRVDGAQGECMDLGVYSDKYGSYPWSVGMMLVVDSGK